MNKILKTKILLLFLLTLLTVNNVTAEGNNQRITTEGNDPLFQITQKRVTISKKDATLRAILKEVQNQSGISILYKDAEVDAVGKKSVEIKNQSVEEALKTILSNTGLDYKITGNSISVFTKKVAVAATTGKRIPVSGKVIDKNRAPIAGATVTVAGTTRGAITDGNGNFTFLTFEQDPIEISFTGKKTAIYKNLALKNKEIIIELVDDALAVDDVIVTGYADMERRNTVMSSETIKAEDFLQQTGGSLESMLQGKIAGLVVENVSSRVGSSPKIQLRGTSTLIGNRDPLWVVDGVIQEDPIQMDPNVTNISDDLKNMIGSQISWLNPMDIDKITVLKDASATAIYGAKASNGVIVITTKKGIPGKLSVNYSGTVKINTKPNYGQFNYMNSKERTNFIDEAFNSGLKYKEFPIEQLQTYEGSKLMYANGKISADTFIARRNRLETVNTDWFDLLTQTGISQSHNLSVSGGSDIATYNASAGYSNNKGQEIGNSSEVMTGRLSVNITPHKKVRINVSITGSSTTNKGFAGVNPIDYATKTSRNIEAYDENGELSFYNRPTSYNYNKELEYLGFNIINERDNSSSEVDLSRIATSLSFNWKILDWLTYNVSGGYNKSTNISQQYKGERTYFAAQKYRGYDYGTELAGSPKFKAAWYPFGGEYVLMNGLQNSYNIQNKILFNREFNEDHRFSAMAAFEIRSSESTTTTTRNAGYAPERGDVFLPPVPLRDHFPLGGATNNGVIPAEYAISRNYLLSNYMSIFATVAYVLKDKYVLNANIRNDFSNKFGQDINRRLDPTYSFGVAWKVSNENFLRGQEKWISNLNLKATYGIQGNAPTISSELTLERRGAMHMMNQYFSTIYSIPNPNLSWERTHTWDLGMEFTLFDVVSATVDYYTRTSNALKSEKISPEFGLKAMHLNAGKLFNEGVEVSVSFAPIQKKDISLNVTLNSSKNWNSIGKNTQPVLWKDYLSGVADKFTLEGYPLGAMWSYDYAGLSPYNGVPMFNNMDLREGDVRGSEINPLPYLVYSGSSIPSFTGGLSLNFRYKSFSFGTSFSVLLGKVKRLPSPYKALTGYYQLPDVDINLSKDLLNRWKKPGDELTTNYPAIVTSTAQATYSIPGDITGVSAYTMWEQSDYMTINSSFLRCREIKLSWRMRNEIAARLGISGLQITGSISNPFVIANKRFGGFDPELNETVMPKEIALGLTISF